VKATGPNGNPVYACAQLANGHLLSSVIEYVVDYLPPPAVQPQQDAGLEETSNVF
jgi:hypothetical protein